MDHINVPGKIGTYSLFALIFGTHFPDLTPRRHHGYSVVLFILGTLLPPLGKSAA